MRAEITDTGMLGTLRPLDIVSYLHATGWHNQEDLGDKASLWVLPGDSHAESQVLVPKRQSFGDFGLRVSEILEILSKVEQRSQLQVFSDVASVSFDLVRLTASNRASAQGTLPLKSGVDFVEGVYDAILAAACSAVVRRGNFPRRKPAQANEYVERVRLGQTERGSFVLTVQCPVTPRLTSQSEQFPPEEPFGRRVTKTLMSSLAAVRSAAEHAVSNGDFAPFRESISAGVSANLCEAVLRLGAVVPEAGIGIAMSWSKSRGLVSSLPTRVLIEPDSFPVIQEAARLFQETEPHVDFQLVGFIQQLRRPEMDPIGRVAIISVGDERARRIVVDLPEAQYAIAADAHSRRKTISCVGELVKEGRSYRLLNPRDLRILEDEDEGLQHSE